MRDQSRDSQAGPIGKDGLADFKYRVLVFGIKDFNDASLFDQCMQKFLKDNNVTRAEDKQQIVFVTGKSGRGVDLLLCNWVKANHYHWAEFLPKWDEVDVEGSSVKYRDGKPYNSRAGFWRDEEMVEVCTHGVSFYDGVSSDTRDMIDRIADLGSPCSMYLVTVDKDEDEHAEEQGRG